MRLTFFTFGFTTSLPIVTCPSAMMTTCETNATLSVC